MGEPCALSVPFPSPSTSQWAVVGSHLFLAPKCVYFWLEGISTWGSPVPSVCHSFSHSPPSGQWWVAIFPLFQSDDIFDWDDFRCGAALCPQCAIPLPIHHPVGSGGWPSFPCSKVCIFLIGRNIDMGESCAFSVPFLSAATTQWAVVGGHLFPVPKWWYFWLGWFSIWGSHVPSVCHSLAHPPPSGQ